MIIENLIEIAKINDNIARIKEHKYTPEEQKRVDEIIKKLEENTKEGWNNFVKEAKNILKGD